MKSINIKDARQQFAKLVNSASKGETVTITRRGKTVAQIAPVQPATRPCLPDLTAFRNSLGQPPRKSIATIRHLRDQARY